MPAATTLRRVKLASASDIDFGLPSLPGCQTPAGRNLSGRSLQFQSQRVNVGAILLNAFALPSLNIGRSVNPAAGDGDRADDVGAAAIAHDETVERLAQRGVA